MVQCWCELKKISLLQCYVKYAVGAGTIKELCGIDGFSDCFEEYLHEFLNSSGHMITFVVLLYGRLFIIIIKNKTKTNSLLCPPPPALELNFFFNFFPSKLANRKIEMCFTLQYLALFGQSVLLQLPRATENRASL